MPKIEVCRHETQHLNQVKCSWYSLTCNMLVGYPASSKLKWNERILKRKSLFSHLVYLLATHPVLLARHPLKTTRAATQVSFESEHTKKTKSWKHFNPVISGGSRGAPPFSFGKKRIREGRKAGETSKKKPPLPPPPPVFMYLFHTFHLPAYVKPRLQLCPSTLFSMVLYEFSSVHCTSVAWNCLQV